MAGGKRQGGSSSGSGRNKKTGPGGKSNSELLLVIAAVCAVGAAVWMSGGREASTPPDAASQSGTAKPPEDKRLLLDGLRQKMQEAKDAAQDGEPATLRAWLDAAIAMDSGLVDSQAPLEVREYILREVQRIALGRMQWNTLLGDKALLTQVAPLLATLLSLDSVTVDCCEKLSCLTAQVQTTMLLEELGQSTQAAEHLRRVAAGAGSASASPAKCLGASWRLDRLTAPVGDHYPPAYAGLIDPAKEPPFWSPKDWPLAAHLEDNAAAIVEELAPICNAAEEEEAHFGTERLASHLARERKSWGSLPLFHDGHWNASACDSVAPKTCALLRDRPELRGALRSAREPETSIQLAFVSVYRLWPGSHIHRHVGNSWRLNTHMGIVTPEGAEIRVWGQKRAWEKGKAFAFLDAAEHEVFHSGTKTRCVLNVVGWHPRVSEMVSKDEDALCSECGRLASSSLRNGQ
eukprot:gnl/TRDRNA2_/TRDRNA2_172745_c0_seq1.p1 gnl/TRDRNA2_/TRDRNA2_172745_c0~~gnl/TRDRNA2_/TRDRNA2_172745_c0_seq1.p1  ORF type:complete len:462 (+),score=70.90 gnl/TRDRNA2_/TRDRNA2_172745_c0_seq1:65-1450(+)